MNLVNDLYDLSVLLWMISITAALFAFGYWLGTLVKPYLDAGFRLLWDRITFIWLWIRQMTFDAYVWLVMTTLRKMGFSWVG